VLRAIFCLLRGRQIREKTVTPPSCEGTRNGARWGIRTSIPMRRSLDVTGYGETSCEKGEKKIMQTRQRLDTDMHLGVEKLIYEGRNEKGPIPEGMAKSK